jgi:hypothetical protein
MNLIKTGYNLAKKEYPCTTESPCQEPFCKAIF